MNEEQLAQYVAAASGEDNISKAPPAPPKPGEVIVCQICGKEMLPNDFSKIPKIRKFEFKWHIHWECQQKLLNEWDENPEIFNIKRAKYLK